MTRTHFVICDASGNEVTRIPVQVADPAFVAELARNIRQSLRSGYVLDYDGEIAAAGVGSVLL